MPALSLSDKAAAMLACQRTVDFFNRNLRT
jgi:hypothetical protein